MVALHFASFLHGFNSSSRSQSTRGGSEQIADFDVWWFVWKVYPNPVLKPKIFEIGPPWAEKLAKNEKLKFSVYLLKHYINLKKIADSEFLIFFALDPNFWCSLKFYKKIFVQMNFRQNFTRKFSNFYFWRAEIKILL